MPRRSKPANAEEIARIETLIDDLTQRLNRLNGEDTPKGTDEPIQTSDFVRDALETIMAQVRERADTVTGQVVEHAAQAGTDAIKRVMADAKHHPLATLAFAAGIGFLVGTARR